MFAWAGVATDGVLELRRFSPHARNAGGVRRHRHRARSVPIQRRDDELRGAVDGRAGGDLAAGTGSRRAQTLGFLACTSGWTIWPPARPKTMSPSPPPWPLNDVSAAARASPIPARADDRRAALRCEPVHAKPGSGLSPDVARMVRRRGAGRASSDQDQPRQDEQRRLWALLGVHQSRRIAGGIASTMSTARQRAQKGFRGQVLVHRVPQQGEQRLPELAARYRTRSACDAGRAAARRSARPPLPGCRHRRERWRKRRPRSNINDLRSCIERTTMVSTSS